MFDVLTWFIAGLQTLLFIAFAPLLLGWIKANKCLLQNRKPPVLWQPYRDLYKLFRKESIVAEQASWIFRAAPYIVFGTTVLAAGVVPLLATDLPTAALADVIVLVGFFALARFFMALAAMDIGTAFGGMGASREMTLSSLTEPAMLMAVFTLAMTASTTNISTTIDFILSDGLVLRPSFFFVLLGLMMVAIAETGRIPIDNPATHLELTMVHEAMILEYSGRHLALIEWAHQTKLMIYMVLIANLFFPWGIAREFSLQAFLWSGLTITLKLATLGAVLAISETLLAKLRLFRAPDYLSFAFLLCLLGMLSHVIVEVG
ncbi:respiratory chain complex I subunit 1 family protein [Beggiatoa leptomitoformis]|uniref:Formate hydrogenlyase n=1 Tax=Beggiatoa leptomitoformis TaxID=288004 RepID=A0A2N9YFY6_9GAMM|nr:NADH-quinone oxidoreductase subunit H [Beggiatoa leptomitoformis]ALG68275.1 formate hydrogenlyase [Beggiatoa leptomitoformis]AUI69414.1 formate hydrogenlyase [Beggiatoa leptomitoformis]